MNLTHEGVLPPDELDDRDERREEREIAQKRETLADIVREKRSMAAEIRANLSNVPVRRDDQLLEADSLDREAERIEAAWKRERESVTKCNGFGNAAAMREALEMAREALKSAEKYVYGDPPDGGAIGWDDVWPSEWHNALEAVERALSAPPRQCDVGTPEEQSERMEKAVCSKHHGCVRCPLRKAKYSDCSLGWAQTPYEAQEGAGK